MVRDCTFLCWRKNSISTKLKESIVSSYRIENQRKPADTRYASARYGSTASGTISSRMQSYRPESQGKPVDTRDTSPIYGSILSEAPSNKAYPGKVTYSDTTGNIDFSQAVFAGMTPNQTVMYEPCEEPNCSRSGDRVVYARNRQLCVDEFFEDVKDGMRTASITSQGVRDELVFTIKGRKKTVLKFHYPLKPFGYQVTVGVPVSQVTKTSQPAR